MPMVCQECVFGLGEGDRERRYMERILISIDKYKNPVN
jgi:hypothetical protein